jgi:cell division protein FtsI/penicillin-binding protein 2
MIRTALLGLLVWSAQGASLQPAMQRAMQGTPGSAVAIEIATGKLLAAYRPDLAQGRAASPGSVLKPFTLAAWIEAHPGQAAPVRPCPRQLRLNGRRVDCTHPILAAPLDAAAALAYSCNCYFARLALDLRPANLARALRALAGNVAQARTPEELQLQGIGEWGIQVTPMELAAGYRRLAQQRARPESGPILEGLEGAVAYGSGQLAAAPGAGVVGKTGTGAGHAWFAGFTRELVVVVFVQQGKGASDAAPIAGEIFRAWGSAR